MSFKVQETDSTHEWVCDVSVRVRIPKRVLFHDGSCWLDCIIGCVMSALATSQNASCHQIPLFPSCTLRSPLLTKAEERHRPAVTKQGMSKEWIPLSLSVAGGSALYPDEGVMCWNVASFHYIKHEVRWRVCHFLFFSYSINCLAVSCDLFHPTAWHWAPDYTHM